MTQLYFDPIVGSFEIDFWGNPVQLSVLSEGGSGPVQTTLTQLSGATDAFTITEDPRRPGPAGGGQTLDGIFNFATGPAGIKAGTYNFRANATDGTDTITGAFQVHQQTIRNAWGGTVIQAEDGGYGNGFGMVDTDTRVGNFNSYRADGLDVSRTADQSKTYLSHFVAGDKVEYTSWTPDGAAVLRVQAATNLTGQSFGVYVDNVFQGNGSVSRQGASSPSKWESFQAIDVPIMLNGYYETIELRAIGTGNGAGTVNIDSFQVLTPQGAGF